MYLSDQFNLSRRQIKEHLKRLENEGLILTKAGSVTQVSAINIEEVKQAFVVVASLHGLAARLAASHLTTNEFDLLETYNDELIASIDRKMYLRRFKRTIIFMVCL